MISIIIRTHNSEEFVRDAINSALRQTAPQELYEIVVVDDDSKDRTRKILNEFGKKINVVESAAIGPVNAINKGIEHASGDYIVLLDADDTFKPEMIKELANVIKNESPTIVYCDYEEQNIETSEKRIISLKENALNSIAVGIMYRKSIVEDVGGYDPAFFFPEYDLLLKTLNQHNGVYIPKPLFTYNRHPKSLTADRKRVHEGIKQLEKKYGPIQGLKKYTQ